MNEMEMKPIFDIIFMMISSLVVVFSIAYGIYVGLRIGVKNYTKNKRLKKIQSYVYSGEFKKVTTFDREGIPVLIEISKNQENKIISL